MSPEKSKKDHVWAIVIGAISILLACAALLVGIAQVWKMFRESDDEKIANATINAYWDTSQKLQETSLAYQAIDVLTGPTASLVAQELMFLQQTQTPMEANYGYAMETLAAVRHDEKPDDIESTPIPLTLTPTATFTPDVSTRTAGINFGFPEALGNNWTWNQGQSTDSTYRISENGEEISIIAGPITDMWSNKTSAPILSYSLSGNFTITAKFSFTGIEEWQVAGMSLGPEDDPTTWIGVRRASGGSIRQSAGVVQTQNNRSEGVTTIPYAKQVVYFKISRMNELFSFWISENGINWLNLKTDLVFSMPADLRLFLYVYSTSSHGFMADFSELSIGPAVGQTTSVALGNVPFMGQASGTMSSLFGWYPGGSASSAFRVDEETLTLIAGPETDLWDTRRTAPFVSYPITGNFQAQVRLDFMGSEEYQIAGFGLLSGTDMGNWIVGRRASGTRNSQVIDVGYTSANNSDSTANSAYPGEVIYFQIRRQEPLISIYYSSDGFSWTPMIEEFVMGFPETNNLIFFVFSTTSHGIQAEFSDFIVTIP